VTLPAGDLERLRTLAHIVERETARVLETESRLFAFGVDTRRLAALAVDPEGSERIEAFAARFGRLQDTLGARLLPALLGALGEPVHTALDNLDRAERLGWITDVAHWQALRQLRNRLIHEYVNSTAELVAALFEAQQALPVLTGAARAMLDEMARRSWLAGTRQ
jgi:hypothetical protein